jgi:hypothetical protein
MSILLLWMTLQGVKVQTKVVIVLEGGEVIEAEKLDGEMESMDAAGEHNRSLVGPK